MTSALSSPWTMRATGTAWFGDGWRDAGGPVALEHPRAVRTAFTREAVLDCVAWVEAEALVGRWGILVLAYEAAPAFDDVLVTRSPVPGLPLAWAASFDEVVTGDAARPSAILSMPPPLPWQAAIDEAHFHADVDAVLRRIAAGDTYQVNLTFPLEAHFDHDPRAWFDALAAQAAAPYAAFVDIDSHVVMSLSPELFLQRDGVRLRTRPMKGTARRGRWLNEDQRLSADLVVSEKARAENVMIVDLLRNDLGRVAVPGTVQVRDLCRLERYPTVWQLTSTVEANATAGTTLLDILRAVFPCGSVTGAPKVETMRIIAGLEVAPRGIYTGAIGLLQPGGDATLSVPIRTATLERATGRATFHVGAGITADSLASDEWAECLAKSRVVRPPAVPEGAWLLETLRLEHGTFARRAGHVARMLGSASLFGWPVTRESVEEALDALARARPEGLWRVRVLASRDGVVQVSAYAFVPDARPRRVALAPRPVDVRSPLLFNKTTARDVYEAARRARPEVDDVLLWNTRREVTESTIANVVVELDGRRVTPPLACGLLPGVLRAELLASGELTEQVVTTDDLARATGLWLINSLRGWMPAQLS